MGVGEESWRIVEGILKETNVPVLLDADAISNLPGPEALAGRDVPPVITPHPGELGRLLGEESSWVDAHRLEAARRAVGRFGCVVLLKGHGTIVAAPDEGPLVCPGAASLATAGTGDVLTGIAAAFLAKGMEPRLAAAAAATAQAEAARAAGKSAGLVASDVAEALPSVL
jgi:NAD(P)H-hydrate epimerase